MRTLHSKHLEGCPTVLISISWYSEPLRERNKKEALRTKAVMVSRTRILLEFSEMLLTGSSRQSRSSDWFTVMSPTSRLCRVRPELASGE